MFNLLKAILNNLDASRKVWSKMSDGGIPADRNEAKTAAGYLIKWEPGSRQVGMYNIMI